MRTGGLLKTNVVLLVAVVASAMLASPASASTIHEPASGITVRADQSVYFDWQWADDQYGSRIFFSQSATPTDPSWYGSPRTATGTYYESHATVAPDSVGLTPGVWYWRLCSKTIYGEDDKCYLESDIRQINVQPTPPTPPACSNGRDDDYDGLTDLADPNCKGNPNWVSEQPECYDGIDNDGDGKIDYLDPECPADKEAAPPAPPTPAPTPTPTLNRGKALGLVREAIRERFSLHPAKLKRSCSRESRTSFRCSVSWRDPKYIFRGKSRVWFKADAWFYSFDLTRTKRRCSRACQKHVVIR